MKSLSADEHLRRAASFDEDAARYDRSRPRYPAEVFDRLWQMAQLGSVPDVVEVGCGTGQASVSLAARGARLLCVELGENMAAIARRNLALFPSAQVVVSKFEDWDSGTDQFDLVFAALSWHWIQKETRYRKAAAVLRQGGHVATIHSHHFYPEGFDPLFHSIQDVYAEVTGSRKEVKAQEIPKPGWLDAEDDEQITELDGIGAFEATEVSRMLWHIDQTADEHVDLLATFSDHWALEPSRRERLFSGIHRTIAESPSGSVRKHYLTTIRVSRRR